MSDACVCRHAQCEIVVFAAKLWRNQLEASMKEVQLGRIFGIESDSDSESTFDAFSVNNLVYIRG